MHIFQERPRKVFVDFMELEQRIFCDCSLQFYFRIDVNVKNFMINVEAVHAERTKHLYDFYHLALSKRVYAIKAFSEDVQKFLDIHAEGEFVHTIPKNLKIRHFRALKSTQQLLPL